MFLKLLVMGDGLDTLSTNPYLHIYKRRDDTSYLNKTHICPECNKPIVIKNKLDSETYVFNDIPIHKRNCYRIQSFMRALKFNNLNTLEFL